jgi:hypothetical protein
MLLLLLLFKFTLEQTTMAQKESRYLALLFLLLLLLLLLLLFKFTLEQTTMAQRGSRRLALLFLLLLLLLLLHFAVELAR